MNKVILSGNIAGEIESRTTGSGLAQASFRLAVQRKFSNQQGERETDFFQVVAFRKTAEFCQKYLAKGRKVIVEGAVQNRSYDAKDGTKRYVTEVIADNVEFADSKPEGAQGGNTAPRGGYNQQPAPRQQGFAELPDDEPLPF